MLEAVTRTSFHHQPEAQHPKSLAIHKNAGRLPHLWVSNGHSGPSVPMSALHPKADIRRRYYDVRFVPCVDGSELARDIFTFAELVGAAMCSACLRGSHDRWP
jgi:hypothetical protein